MVVDFQKNFVHSKQKQNNWQSKAATNQTPDIGHGFGDKDTGKPSEELLSRTAVGAREIEARCDQGREREESERKTIAGTRRKPFILKYSRSKPYTLSPKNPICRNLKKSCGTERNNSAVSKR
jgi:hypothetical protein